MNPLGRSTLVAAAAAAVVLSTTPIMAQQENPVLGGWPEIPVGNNEIAFLVQATGNQSNYDPELKVGVCLKDIYRLQVQVVAGTNYRYQGHGCVLPPGGPIGACTTECPLEDLQVTIFTQEWSNTLVVSGVERMKPPPQ